MLQFKDYARSENFMVKDDDGNNTMIAIVFTSSAICVGMEYNKYMHEWRFPKDMNNVSYERIKFNRFVTIDNQLFMK